MTSNIGTEAAGKIRALGFSDSSEKDSAVKRNERMLSALKNEFKPEFLNRLDEIIVFNTLSQNDTVRITERFLVEVSNRAEKIGLRINFDKSVAEMIAKNNYDVSFGARPLRRSVTKEVEDVISEKYLRGEFKDVKNLWVYSKNGELIFETK